MTFQSSDLPELRILLTKTLQFRLIKDSRTCKLFLQRRDRGRKEVVSSLLDDPAFQRHTVPGSFIVTGKTDRARRVMLKSLTHNGINTRTVLTNKLCLAVGEVVVACPAWINRRC